MDKAVKTAVVAAIAIEGTQAVAQAIGPVQQARQATGPEVALFRTAYIPLVGMVFASSYVIAKVTEDNTPLLVGLAIAISLAGIYEFNLRAEPIGGANDNTQ